MDLTFPNSVLTELSQLKSLNPAIAQYLVSKTEKVTCLDLRGEQVHCKQELWQLRHPEDIKGCGE